MLQTLRSTTKRSPFTAPPATGPTPGYTLGPASPDDQEIEGTFYRFVPAQEPEDLTRQRCVQPGDPDLRSDIEGWDESYVGDGETHRFISYQHSLHGDFKVEKWKGKCDIKRQAETKPGKSGAYLVPVLNGGRRRARRSRRKSRARKTRRSRK